MTPDRRIAALNQKHARLEGLLATELSGPGARDEDRNKVKRDKLRIKDELERLDRESMGRRRVALQ